MLNTWCTLEEIGNTKEMRCSSSLPKVNDLKNDISKRILDMVLKNPSYFLFYITTSGMAIPFDLHEILKFANKIKNNVICFKGICLKNFPPIEDIINITTPLLIDHFNNFSDIYSLLIRNKDNATTGLSSIILELLNDIGLIFANIKTHLEAKLGSNLFLSKDFTRTTTDILSQIDGCLNKLNTFNGLS